MHTWILFISLYFFGQYITLAAKLTTSPRTENSFLEPEVPTTPENTTPVAIPILHQQSNFYSSCRILSPQNIALAASSSCANGESPHIQIRVDPLSSITSLLRDPSIL